MKGKYLLLVSLISSLCFTSCTKSRTDDSKEESLSDASIESVSESESSEPAPERLISLYNKDSKFYINSLTASNISSLKTYRHKDFDDVPFVDFEEFHYAIRPYIERGRSFSQIDNDNYVYSTTNDKGKMYFDTKNDVIKYVNFNGFLDALGVNNGICGDVTQNSIKLYKESEKTKYIIEGQDVTINLKDYGFDLVSENNRLYVSIGVLNSTVFPSFVSGLSYNGKDFFVDSFLRRLDLSVYARSGNYNFSWPLASSENPSAFKKVENKLDNEEYRFEAIFADRDNRDDLVTMSLFKDGSGTVNGSGGAIIHRAIKWRLEDNVLKLVTAQTPYESSDLEDATSDLSDIWINTKETNYGKKIRSEKMTQENYHELCLSFDLSYGLKKEKNIQSFDKYFQDKNLKDRLLSNDILVYEDAFAELICKHIDDIHSSINGGESVYSASETKSYLRDKAISYQGERYKAYYDEVRELGQLRETTDSYVVEGNTAILRFQMFAHNELLTHPINHQDYKTESHEAAVLAYNSVVNSSPYKAFAIAFNDIAKLDIKNIVIDIACNIGGEIRCAPYLAAFMTLDPSIVVGNQMDGSLIDYHYKVDLNGDGVYGGDGDSFAGQYKFYILGGANFSAGNEFSAMAKNTGFAKIIGRKSAGGGCAITNRTDISGLTYRLSSMYSLMLKNGDNYVSNDSGVDVDLNIPFENMFDFKQLNTWLNTLE